MKSIERVNIDHYEGALAQERQKLLSDAATKLGYRPAQKNSLIYQLLDLDIVPFKTKAVEAYMCSKKREGVYSGTRNWLIWLFCTLVGTVMQFAWFKLPEKPTPLAIVGCVFLAVLGFGCFCSWIGLLSEHSMIGHGRRKKRVWHNVGIAMYEGTIPDHVLRLAVQISSIPNTTLDIMYLAETEDYKARPLPDPFLRVSKNGETWIVEQWDEKDLPRVDA